MGCDIEFFGAVADPDARGECLAFLALAMGQQPRTIYLPGGTAHRGVALVFRSPEARQYIRAARYEKFHAGDSAAETFEGIREDRWSPQILFDVSRAGNLCTLVLPDEIPEAFNPEDERDRWREAPPTLSPWEQPVPPGAAAAMLGGRTRIDTQDPFLPVLLVCLKCRFIPGLIVSDDYFLFREAYAIASDRELDRRFATADPCALAGMFREFAAALR